MIRQTRGCNSPRLQVRVVCHPVQQRLSLRYAQPLIFVPAAPWQIRPWTKPEPKSNAASPCIEVHGLPHKRHEQDRTLPPARCPPQPRHDLQHARVTENPCRVNKGGAHAPLLRAPMAVKGALPRATP